MKLQAFFVKYELPLFFLLTYALSWWTAPLMRGGLFPYGPSIAAVIMIALTAGRPGLRQFWGRLTTWGSWKWYLVGPGIVMGYLMAAFVLNLLLGATISTPPHLPSISVLIQLLLIGGMWEEPGWTGYAYPLLRERYAQHTFAALDASLILGLLWGVWHLPLFLYGTLPWYDIFVFVPAIRVIFSWLYNSSRGSVPAVMVTHYASNVLAGSTMLLVFTGAERTSYYILMVISASVAALLIAWRSHFKLGELRDSPSAPAARLSAEK